MPIVFRDPINNYPFLFTDLSSLGGMYYNSSKESKLVVLNVIITGTPFATISGILRAQIVSSPARSADPKEEVEEW